MNDPIRDVSLVHAKDHPVLPESASWRLHWLRLDLETSHGDTGTRVEMVLRREDRSLRMRCDGVADFAMRCDVVDVALRILDVTHLQWSGIAVRVESVCGALGFWAASVVAEGTAPVIAGASGSASSANAASRPSDGPNAPRGPSRGRRRT